MTTSDPTTQDRRLAVTTCLADVEAQDVQWLWPGRVPLGKLSLLAGDPGLGKSLITLDMAARVSAGRPWPDLPDEPALCGGVVLLSAEDDLADTIRPRLDAAGADVTRICTMEAVRRFDHSAGWREAHFDLSADLPALAEAIQQTPDCRLVVIDPISAYLGRADSHKNAEIQGLLRPLAKVAGEYGVAVVSVTHLRKSGSDGSAMYRAMGSLAFVAVPRASWAVTKDPDDPSGQRRLLLPLKANLAPDVTGLAYRLDATDNGNRCPVVQWDSEPVTVPADDALRPPDRTPGPTADARHEAEEWLTAALANGPQPANELYKRAKAEAGISESTLRRTKTALGVRAKRLSQGQNGDGCWQWCLPGETAPDTLRT